MKYMANNNKIFLSENTQQIITEIDTYNETNQLGFDYSIFDIDFLKSNYDFIFNHYKSINYSKKLIKESIINGNNNFCGTFELLDYILSNDKFKNFKTQIITIDNKTSSLEEIVSSKNQDNCKIWINLHGKELLRLIFSLKYSNNLPEKLFEEFDRIDIHLLTEFTPFDIFEFISNNDLKKQQYLIKFKTFSINLCIISKDNLVDYKLDLLIKRICLMLVVKNNYTNNTINISIILSNFKKNLPSSYSTLGPREINSGVSIKGLDYILIYREEEFLKLIIHELVHLISLDIGTLTIDNLNEYVDINSSNEIRLNESITEIISLIINSIVIALELGYTNNNKGYNFAKTILNYELYYNLFQCSKILKHFNYSNTADFFKQNTTSLFKQNTSVLSYFIVKTACLFNSDFKTYFNTYFDNFNYNDKPTTVQNYKSLIINSLQNSHFINTLQKISESITINNDYFMKTLRMTCFEIN